MSKSAKKTIAFVRHCTDEKWKVLFCPQQYWFVIVVLYDGLWLCDTHNGVKLYMIQQFHLNVQRITAGQKYQTNISSDRGNFFPTCLVELNHQLIIWALKPGNVLHVNANEWWIETRGNFGLINSRHSEKVTKFENNYPLVLALLSECQKDGRFFKNFVAFSENLNFTFDSQLTYFMKVSLDINVF